jgi:hypothetical protein
LTTPGQAMPTSSRTGPIVWSESPLGEIGKVCPVELAATASRCAGEPCITGLVIWGYGDRLP